MEFYIKNKVNDITYKSELTPNTNWSIAKSIFPIGVGVNSPNKLTFTSFRKFGAH